MHGRFAQQHAGNQRETGIVAREKVFIAAEDFRANDPVLGLFEDFIDQQKRLAMGYGVVYLLFGHLAFVKGSLLAAGRLVDTSPKRKRGGNVLKYRRTSIRHPSLSSLALRASISMAPSYSKNASTSLATMTP